MKRKRRRWSLIEIKLLIINISTIIIGPHPTKAERKINLFTIRELLQRRGGALQALIVLDYALIIYIEGTALFVWLRRGREAVSELPPSF